MSSHVPSPASSPASSAHDASGSPHGSQDATFRSSQGSNHDSSTLSLESSFQLESGYSSQQIDSERHPKGKRKRTTTQDKTILESAYNANPKPDKAARLDLVKRVSLNEKEVQIWFQNRRQNDRRKSRPLSPQEIAALRYGGGMHVLSSDSAPFGSADALETREETRSGEVDKRSPTPVNNSSSEEFSQLSLEGVANAAESPKQERRNSDSAVLSPSSPDGEAGYEFQALSQSLPSSVGYLANRWNTGNSFSTPSTLNQPGDESFRLESFPSSANSTAHSSPVSVLPLPSAASSQFRLSLSLEGKAEIVSAQQSPPRPAQPPLSIEATTLPPVRAPRALHRSRSALPGITLPPISALTANLPPQLTRGRSRNVHAWESCCEADTRDELTTLAENESSGSAVAAISLLRSSSQTASLSNLVHGHTSTSSMAMPSNSTKRNAPPSRRDSTKKPRLARASSSVARMQSLPPIQVPSLEKPELVADVVDPEKKTNKASLSVILSPSGGDSDKENWSPDEDGNPIARRRPLPSVAPPKTQSQRDSNPRRLGRVLGEQGTSKRQLLGSRANTAPVPRLRGGKAINTVVSIFEDGEGDGEGPAAKRGKPGDDEVERFLRGEVSPSKKGDVDCVAGLLALSQGNWR